MPLSASKGIETRKYQPVSVINDDETGKCIAVQIIKGNESDCYRPVSAVKDDGARKCIVGFIRQGHRFANYHACSVCNGHSKTSEVLRQQKHIVKQEN